MAFGDSPQAAQLIRDWMNEVLRENEWSAAHWAGLAGVAASTVQRALKPTYEFVTSSRTLAKLAAAADTSPPNLKSSLGVQLHPEFLNVRYRAQAGFWAEVEDLSATTQFDRPIAPDPRFAQWPQWLEEVVGDSANKRIQPGAFAHVVDAVEMGYSPRDGDWVVVERVRDGGHLRERSVKQVAVTRDGIELWPRSTNPRWSTPLRLDAGVENDDTAVVQIVGLVVGVYEAFV